MLNKTIDQATHQLAAFKKTKSLDDLTGSIETLEGIEPAAAQQARREVAKAWLLVLVAIDLHLDPRFDPADVPAASLIPPPSNGMTFPAGVDPKALHDSKARAEYEAALKKNREKAEAYLFQTRLRRLDARATDDVEQFLTSSYHPTPGDQAELDQLGAEVLLGRDRRTKISNLFRSP